MDKKETERTISVAIDGPSGSGKSTLSRAAAKELSLLYVDTGAIYRTTALHTLRRGVSPGESAAVAALLPEIDIALSYDAGGMQRMCLNGEDVTELIRTQEVSMAASAVSAYPAVRAKLVELQRQLAAKSDVIMDGRDIGTCVLPDAQVKIYLTASSATRAKRRFDELTAKGTVCDLAAIERDIIDRDYRDMHRETSPLKQAEDAVLVDSSKMDIDEVVDAIYQIYREAV